MNMLLRVTVQRRRPGRSRRRAWCAATAAGMAVAVSLTTTPALAAAVASSGGDPERGIDISAYQHANGPINWRELARHGIKFVADQGLGRYLLHQPVLPVRHRGGQAGRAGGARVHVRQPRPGGRRGQRRLRRPGRARPTRPPRAAPGRRSGERPVLDQRLLLVRPGRDDRLDRRVRQASQGADRVSGRSSTPPPPGGRSAPGRPAGSRATRSGWPTTTAAGRRPSPWTRWSFWQYSENGYLPGIGWTDLDYFQSADGLPSLRPASDPKPKHRHKRRPSTSTSQEARSRSTRSANTKPNRKSAPSASERASIYQLQFISLPAFPPDRLISSAGDSAQASPRYRGNHAHPRYHRRARARGRGADGGQGIGRAGGHHAARRRRHRRLQPDDWDVITGRP